MARKKLRNYTAHQLVDSLACERSDEGTDILKELCPCRNRVVDPKVWHEVFLKAREGSQRERHQAIHAIATLLQKAQSSPPWRKLMRELEDDLDQVMAHPVASGMLVGEVAHQARHAKRRKGSARETFRRQRRAMDLTSRRDLAAWANATLGLRKHSGVPANHPGIDRLWRWLSHRVAFQARRRTAEEELLRKASQWLPEFFQTG